MPVPRLGALVHSPTLRFTLPVMLENTLTIFIGLVFSRIISTISGSALAAIGMANTVMAVIFSLFSMVTTGAAVLVSRQIGAGEGAAAADTIEQGGFLSLACSAGMTALCLLTAQPLLRLLMPTAEDQLFSEALRYYDMLMLSLPAYVLHGMLSSAARSTGDSRSPMAVALLMNLSQIAFAYLFIDVLPLQEVGAGLSYVCCRLVGAGLMLGALVRDHRFFVLRLRNMLRPRGATVRRILRLGLPVSAESLFVQVGYMLANSMSISLGTFESSVYQVMNTLNTFLTLPQGICSTVGLSAVGRLLGAKTYRAAKRTGRWIWLAGIGATLLLSAIVLVFRVPLAGVYTSNPLEVESAASLMWILLAMDVAGVSINAIDAQLRAGGDVRYVMVVTLTAVWLIRLPLTYLFCFVWDWGVLGIYLANTISLYYRAILGLVRHGGQRWMTRRV